MKCFVTACPQDKWGSIGSKQVLQENHYPATAFPWNFTTPTLGNQGAAGRKCVRVELGSTTPRESALVAGSVARACTSQPYLSVGHRTHGARQVWVHRFTSLPWEHVWIYDLVDLDAIPPHPGTSWLQEQSRLTAGRLTMDFRPRAGNAQTHARALRQTNMRPSLKRVQF